MYNKKLYLVKLQQIVIYSRWLYPVKAIYNKLNFIYPSHSFENVLSILSAFFLTVHICNHQYKSFSQYSPSIFSILFFVFIQIDCVCCCAILTTDIRARRKSPRSVKMESSKIGIEKFDGSDFGFWKMQIEYYLYQKGLHEPLLGVKLGTMTTEQWKLKDRQALRLIRLTLSRNLTFNIIKICTKNRLL